MIAGLICWGVLTLTALAICSDAKRREQVQAQQRHPSNYTAAVHDVHVYQLHCPACDASLHETAIIVTDEGPTLCDEDTVADIIIEHGRTCPDAHGRVIGS